MNFVGQDLVKSKLNAYSIQNLPHSIIFIGKDGCGKKTLARNLACRLGLNFTEVTRDTDLIDAQQVNLKTLYLIDLSKLTLEKDQNRFLKFIEEPLKNVYIILTNTSEVGVLPTILNRCVKIRFNNYSVDELKQVKQFDDNVIYKVCATPGQLLSINNNKIAELFNLCKTIVYKCNVASYANLLSIVTRINFKEDYNKFDFNIFLSALEYVSFNIYKSENLKQAATIYLYLIKRKQELVINTGIAKEQFMISFLDGLWKEIK